MKSILEYLSTKAKNLKPYNSEESDPDDPMTWKTDDILCGSWSYTMTLPRWYRIVKRTDKMFTLQRLEGKLVSGHHNGQWEEIASDETYYNEKPIRVKLNKRGYLVVDGRIILRLWDGKTPLQGDDMD